MLKIRDKIIEFISNDKHYPVIAALGAGLYPLLYYYSSNYTLVNSLEQFVFMVITFILLPVLVFSIGYNILKRAKAVTKWSDYLLPVLNFILFGALIIVSTYGFGKKKLLLAIIIGACLGMVLKKHYKKVIVFQMILAIIAGLKLVPSIYNHLFYSDEWTALDDHIGDVEFKKTPNIYVIQPDGYVNFLELKKTNYNYNNEDFEAFLKNNDFRFYEDFRSNYYSTLSSNSSMFAMRHHYYPNASNNFNEVLNARDIIVGNNSVLNILKSNNYKTHLLLETSYLLVNRPAVAYDYCNIDYEDVSYLSRGFDVYRNLEQDLKSIINKPQKHHNFFFIERLIPGHVSSTKSFSKGKNQERIRYLNALEKANEWLKTTISVINQYDDDPLIIIVSDHGGFVGYDFTPQTRVKQKDPRLVNSIFSTVLTIKWPNDIRPQNDSLLKTNVNLFRYIFSQLSNDETLLNAMESDESYIIINEDGKEKVYTCINANGEVRYEAL